MASGSSSGKRGMGLRLFRMGVIAFIAAWIIFGFIPDPALQAEQIHIADRLYARTPPMGFNGWNAFGCNVNEQVIKQTADKLVSSGLRDAGYRYLNLDDCWMEKQRDSKGNLVPDPAKFPHGLKALGQYIHSKGLKFGIYESAASKTCAGFPGSKLHEWRDARLFASFRVDYLKYDGCGGSLSSFERMRKAIRASGRPIVFSMHGGPNGVGRADNPKKARMWIAVSLANLWRTTFDIKDDWSHVIAITDINAPLARYAGPGHWNDPDMLEVGNGGMTTEEYRSHFSLWAEMSAPLLIGTDIRKISRTDLDILKNREVIAVDQDPLGMQGIRVSHTPYQDIWIKPLANGDVAVLLLNRTIHRAGSHLDVSMLGLSARRYKVRDLWAHKTFFVEQSLALYNIPPHGVKMFRVSAADG